MPNIFKPANWSKWFNSSWFKRHFAGSAEHACALATCSRPHSLWRRIKQHCRPGGTFLQGIFYCQPRCLDTALMEQLSRLRGMPPTTQPPNRIPLGLLMVARGKLTYTEVRAALEAQRRARYGKIGEWIQKLGFASENEVTKALALQWGCAVATSFDPSASLFASGIPLPILEAFQMLPLNYVASSNTLYLAFGERVDHAALYAIEKILDCRTVPCVAGREGIARKLDTMRQLSRPSDVEFGPMSDLSEMARIDSSYTARLSPAQVRLSRVGRFIWLRLDVNPNTRSHVRNLHRGVERSSIERSPRGMVQSKPYPIATNVVFRLPNDSPRLLLTRAFRDLYPVNPLQTR